MSLIFFPTLIGFVSHVDLKKMPMSPCQIKGSRALTLYKCHISDTMIHKLHLSTLRVEVSGKVVCGSATRGYSISETFGKGGG